MKKILLFTTFIWITKIAFSQLMIVGPTSPYLNVSNNGSQVTISMYNPPMSNNYLEQYAELINDNSYLAPGYTDSILNFQGYLIYQVLDTTVTFAERFDTNRTRLVWQCDIQDMVDTLINEEMDSLNNCAQVTKVNGANLGIIDTFTLTINPFTHQPYQLGDNPCFYGKAYAYNPFMINPNCSSLPSPFFEHQFMHHKVCLFGLFDIEQSEIQYLNIFPNPIGESFQITGDFTQAQLVIMDMHGQIIINKHILPSEKIFTDELSNGFYIARIVDGNKINYRRLVVNR